MVKSAGTSNWSKAETDHLLSIVEVVLPISPADWEDIKVRHDAKFGNKQRTVSALQRKFTTLHRTKEPTGNPNIPSPVLSAKRIRNMIDEKCDGTRGSADSKVDDISDDDEDEDNGNDEGPTAMVNDFLSITPLTHNAVSQLARLGGHADKPFFQPIVQVIYLHKKPASELYAVHISDGISYMSGTCAQAVSVLANEEYFTLFSFIKVQEFAITTLANGTKSCELLLVENPMFPNPGEKIGNTVVVSQPVVPRLPALPLRSPVPTSIEFGQSLRAMRLGSAKKSGSGGGGNDDFTNIIHVMLMQQQADREQRMADREHRNFLADQDKLERLERERQQQLEREERANQAREDRIQQQQDRMQQQQFMNMMMMQMMGMAKKRGREESDGGNEAKERGEESDGDNDDEQETNFTPRKSPRKK